MRRFEMAEGTSNKFWEISVEGATTTVRYGRIGTEGRVETKDHGSGAAATAAADKLIAEKLKKGYREVGAGAPAAASAPAPTPPAAPGVDETTRKELAKTARALIAAKDPDKALKKAAPKGKGPELLWQIAGAGLFELEDRHRLDACGGVVALLASTAAAVPLAPVRAALETVDEARLTSGGLLSIVEASYDAHPGEWDAAWEALPPFLQGAVALRRAELDKDVPPARREHLLELLAREAAGDPHPDGGDADRLARLLDEEGEAWERRVLRHVLARGIDRALDRASVALSLKHAPWETVREYFTRFPTSSSLADVLGPSDHPALELWGLMKAQDLEGTDEFLRVIVPLAARQGVILPADADERLVDAIDGGEDDPAFLAGLGKLPPARLRAMFDQLREKDSRFALRLWRFVGDPAVEREIAERLQAAVAEPEEWEGQELVELVAGAGGRARALFETLSRELRGREPVQAKGRLLLRKGVIRSWLEEGGPAPLDALLPDDDLPFLDSLADLFGEVDTIAPLFARLSEADRARLVETWTRLDWDHALGVEEYFGVEHEDLDVETAPWEELAALVAQTSLRRLYEHRQLVFGLFERADPVDARIAVAQALIERVNDDSSEFREVFEAIVYSVAPSLAEAGRGLPASWEPALLELARGSSLGGGTVQRLATLPAAWLRPLVDRLLADEDDTAQANGQALRDEAFPDGAADEVRAPSAPPEDPVVRVRRLAAACGQPLTQRIYALVRVDEPNGSARRTASRPLGLAEADWPSVDETPMEHVITLDFESMPELRAAGDFEADVAAVAVFISNREQNEAYTSFSGLTELVPLDAAQLAAGHADEGASYDVVALDVPEGLFDDDALAELRHAVRQLEGRALGAPQFIQSQSEGYTGFLAQLQDSLVPGLNCGDGELYIFADAAWWEC